MSSQGQSKAMARLAHAIHKIVGSCRETGHLSSRAMDEKLPIGQRLRLRMHLAMCAFCRRNARQLELIRQFLRHQAAVDEQPEPGLSDQARQRIQSRLSGDMS